MTRRFSKKRFLVATILGMCVLIAIAALAMWVPPNGVTKANFDRIKGEMSEAEVEAIFGRRADEKGPLLQGGNFMSRWSGSDDHAAMILFIDGSVGNIAWVKNKETVLDRIRRWFHWR